MNWMNRQFIIGVIILSSFGGCVKHAFAYNVNEPYKADASKVKIPTEEVNLDGFKIKEIRCTDSQFDEIDDICSEVTDDDQRPQCIQDAIKMKCL